MGLGLHIPSIRANSVTVSCSLGIRYGTEWLGDGDIQGCRDSEEHCEKYVDISRDLALLCGIPIILKLIIIVFLLADGQQRQL